MTKDDALALFRKAESMTGIEGARKRWRMAAQALATVCNDPDGQKAFSVAHTSHKRADWRNAARTLAKALGEQKTASKPAPKPERLPMTLCEYLAGAGGLNDVGGDLAALDAGKWHKAKAFRRRLIRPDGLSLEYAADLAFERGYFDHVAPPSWDGPDNMHPVTPDMLIAAIDRELCGQPVYPNATDAENVAYVSEDWTDQDWADAYPEFAEAA